MADGLQAIDDVAKPELQIDYQPVSPDEVKIAVVALQEKGWGTKKRFREIAHTDSLSLRRQEKFVTEEINRGLMAIRAAQIKRELQQALDRALRAIDGVAQPQLIKEFQAVAATDRQRAIDAVAAAGQQKKQLFKKVVHVEPDSLNQQINFVDQLVKKAMISLQQAQTNRELVSIMVNAFKEINAVANPAKLIDYQPVSPNDVRHALAVLQQIGQEKSEFFNQIIGIDQRSLAKQQAELERVISNGIVQLKQAETNREFEQSFQGICQSIRAVAKPTIRRELQKVTAAEKTQSVAFLEQAAQRQRDSFKKIAHVDQKSLDQQLSVLDEVLKVGTQLINQAKTKGDFAKASEQALTAVRAVAKPVVEFDYQEVNVQAVSQAYSKLLDIVSAKQKKFKQILHADPMSLVKQMQLLDTIMKATTIELNQSMIQKDIRNAYNKGAKALNLVAVPKILNQYQPVTSEECLLGQRTLQNACTEKKADFAAINHVDQERLEAQKLVLDSVLATGLQELQQAKTNASFRKTLATNLDRIQRVKKPSIQKDYQLVTDMNRYLAQQAINYAGQAKKQAIFAVKHGEQKSVQRQVEAVQKTVAQTQLAIIRAAVQGEVERAVKTGFELLAKVAGPVLEFDYQPVTLADRNQAFLVLNQAANNKKATFTAIDHVDPVNLSLQVSLIEKNRTNGQELLLGAKNKKDLRQKLATTLMHFDQVADPLKTIGYRQVEVSDQADAKNQLKIAAENQKQKFAALVGVDPESLAQQQALANHRVDQSRTDGELKTACQQGLAAIRQIAPPHVLEELQPASITDKKLAKDYLNQIVAKCQQSFRQINHVDQTSLTQQLQLLNQASEQGKKSIDEATTKGALNQVLSHAEQAITRISQPGLHPLFQPVSQDEKAAFDDILVHQATLKKDQFTAIVHVDQESFSQQQQAIDQALAQAKDLVAEAKTKFDLNRAFVTGLQGIQDVAQSVIQVEFRPVVKADRKQALAIVNQAFLKKQKYFVGLQMWFLIVTRAKWRL
ncbi:hypothetical protein [Fructobacillus americanaquae]|uniref:Uncharacterized protein n=1 Tax=Fructobacillus americanaquae TaxID=2940302 RepID=A0ABY5C0K0_9LACO|nr:hypothetical protein [Fructobacillus americanaquae]USS92289.1 hypothetical protein M3M36_01345 [Fructobacillus americanaquae]